MVGHFGSNALVAAILAVVALIIHLAVPFGVNDYDSTSNDFGQPDESVTRADISDRMEFSNAPGGASPGTTLTGVILALVAGVLLLLLGFVPMPVVALRFVGWLVGLLGSIGAFLGLVSSAYWLGAGFSTLLSAVLPNPEPIERLWIISPVITFALCMALFVFFLRIMTAVVAKRDGLRDGASHQMRGALFAAIFVSIVLVMPWSFQILEGGDRRDAGLCGPAESCEPSYTFFTAFGHGSHETTTNQYAFDSFGGILAIADATSEDDPGLFQGLALSIGVMTATAWVGFLVSAVSTFGHLMSSAFKLPAAARTSPLILVLSLLMIVWSAVMFILAASYQWRPTWDNNGFLGTLVTDQTWLPGFLSFAAGAVLVFWALNQFAAVKDAFGGFGVKKPAAPVSFD